VHSKERITQIRAQFGALNLSNVVYGLLATLPTCTECYILSVKMEIGNIVAFYVICCLLAGEYNKNPAYLCVCEVMHVLFAEMAVKRGPCSSTKDG